ncbi:hypothetical protein Nepgr_000339 [Nepenthes gracilis]|uniref:Uncharacterized protein n=1 Tax=Nepenthes gracilis TaxID=150966 RepID=A0AAD3P1Q0_NEPGR|nr:hypothetical protein Nepgr_000339 [Nepenthes gracilis]
MLLLCFFVPTPSLSLSFSISLSLSLATKAVRICHQKFVTPDSLYFLTVSPPHFYISPRNFVSECCRVKRKKLGCGCEKREAWFILGASSSIAVANFVVAVPCSTEADFPNLKPNTQPCSGTVKNQVFGYQRWRSNPIQIDPQRKI